MQIQTKGDVGDYVYIYPMFYSTPFKNGDKVKILQIIRRIDLVDFEIDEAHIKNVSSNNYIIKNDDDKTFLIYNSYLFEGHDTLYSEGEFDLELREIY